MLGIINNINFTGVKNIYKQSPISFTGKLPWYLTEALKGDTFVKSTEAPIDNDKLKEEIPNDFIDWAKENDFVKKGLKDALKPENLIGEGFEHAVYNIPGNDDYVLRIKRNYYGTTQEIDYSNYKLKDTRDMEIQGNIGQQVAMIETDEYFQNGVLTPNIEVLKKQRGFANGNPPPTALYHENGELREEAIPYEDDSRKRNFAKSLKALAEFPDETYDQLIEDLLLAGEAGYKFDHNNSNNFLIDTENQRINIIDMGKVQKPHKDRFGNTLYALINLEFLGEYTRKDSGYVPESENEINDTIGNMITVMDKYSAAMKRKMQKFNANSYEFNNLLHNIVSSFWLRTHDYNEKLQKLRDMGLLYESAE